MNDSLIRWLFWIHLASTLFMIGVIWFVQIIHYPLFSSVGSAEFPAYEKAHTKRTAWVVAPPMLVELGTATLLLLFRPASISLEEALLGWVLLVIIWVSTYRLQIPDHERLTTGFDHRVHRHLVMSNWIRTVAWSARGLLVMVMANNMLQ